MNKLPASVVPINPHSTDDGPDLPPPTPAASKKKCSNAMTRRTFCGLFFGMGWDIHKSLRKSNITPTAASEELRDHGYEEWRRRTGRAA